MKRAAFNFRRTTALWKNLQAKAAAGKIFFLLAAVSAPFFTGCGFHYFNAKTGVEHVWGFGHLRLRVLPPTNSLQAVIKGCTIVGAKFGGSQDDFGLSLGYDARRMIYISPLDAQFSLEWPRASFFNVRLGTNVPPHFNFSPPTKF